MLANEKWGYKVALDDTAKHLLAAADYMERHGWCQGQSQDHAGRVCVYGALRETATTGTWERDAFNIISYCGDPKPDHAWHRLAQYLGGRGDSRYPSGWNDHVCQSEQEAVSTLRAAAYHQEN